MVRAWDLASSANPQSDSDFTAGVLMGKDPATQIHYVIDVVRGRWTPAQVEQRIRSTAILDGEETTIRIPQDPGGAGKFQAAYLVSKLQGYSVAAEREERSKEFRANPFAAQCENFFVKLVEGPWNQSFVDELCAFPNGAHDDQVDAAAAAFRALQRRVFWHAA
jgi:predicted phage terminase large subunit-like protein